MVSECRVRSHWNIEIFHEVGSAQGSYQPFYSNQLSCAWRIIWLSQGDRGTQHLLSALFSAGLSRWMQGGFSDSRITRKLPWRCPCSRLCLTNLSNPTIRDMVLCIEELGLQQCHVKWTFPSPPLQEKAHTKPSWVTATLVCLWQLAMGMVERTWGFRSAIPGLKTGSSKTVLSLQIIHITGACYFFAYNGGWC